MPITLAVDAADVAALSADLAAFFADAEAQPLEAIAAMCRQIQLAAQAVPGHDPDTILDWAARLFDT